MIFYFNFPFTFPKGGCNDIFKERLLCVINCIRTYTFLCNKMCYNYALLGSRGFNFSYHYLLVEHTCTGVRFYRNVRGKMALADTPPLSESLFCFHVHFLFGKISINCLASLLSFGRVPRLPCPGSATVWTVWDRQFL